MSYDFSQMPRFLRELEQGADMVIGCRMPRGGGAIQAGAMPFLHRWLGNPLLSLMGLFSEVFSRRIGFLPPSKLFENIIRAGPFEIGLYVGGAVFGAGLICLLAAFLKWRSLEYGNLSYPDTLRLVTPAVMGMSLGIEIIFGGFLLAVLGLNTRSETYGSQD